LKAAIWRSPDALGNLGMGTFRDLKGENEVIWIIIQEVISKMSTYTGTVS